MLITQSLDFTRFLLSTQQRHLLQVGKAAQRSGSSALSTFLSCLNKSLEKNDTSR
ncbi:hypothetical protein I8752_13550 [Nostocaceae cyanobacterium CENA369]|uniref:Uncharacterized protein n=1 Tax=Dendronalium phyllosphericum CENA369 TaxID=1725256 RepID=A0A8J7I3L7_9NOST|nr:hypothetical protein [Dendronalium phyllosphericum]MBH8574030.1 hypothetical protein [Dendronalium phyllosphericum CENA369]